MYIWFLYWIDARINNTLIPQQNTHQLWKQQKQTLNSFSLIDILKNRKKLFLYLIRIQPDKQFKFQWVHISASPYVELCSSPVINYTRFILCFKLSGDRHKKNMSDWTFFRGETSRSVYSKLPVHCALVM